MQNKNNLENVAVTANAVCKGFGAGETRTEVLKEVNFEACLGELLLLIGPSGCGKTTLLSVIAGTLTVDSGEVDSGRERGVHAASPSEWFYMCMNQRLCGG